MRHPKTAGHTKPYQNPLPPRPLFRSNYSLAQPPAATDCTVAHVAPAARNPRLNTLPLVYQALMDELAAKEKEVMELQAAAQVLRDSVVLEAGRGSGSLETQGRGTKPLHTHDLLTGVPSERVPHVHSQCGPANADALLTPSDNLALISHTAKVANHVCPRTLHRTFLTNVPMSLKVGLTGQGRQHNVVHPA